MSKKTRSKARQLRALNKPLGKSGPVKIIRPPKPQQLDVLSDSFLVSYEWRVVRMQALKKYGAQCQCCGVSPPRAVMNVDHVKPRRLFPALALDVDNLQILCDACNHGKGNWDQTDWRPEDADPEIVAMLRQIAHGS